MRKIIFILFLLLIPSVSADITKEFDDLGLNDTVSVYGKTLTILSVIGNKARVDVDGVQSNIELITEKRNVNGMIIQVLRFEYVDPDYLEMMLRITVYNECGDKKCEDSETSKSCCKDCGCEKNSVCVDNICHEQGCAINADCNDNNPCTVDECSNTTIKTCSHKLISECKSGDNCCPKACNATNDDECMKISDELDKALLEAKKKELLEALDYVDKRLKELESKEPPKEEPKSEPTPEPEPEITPEPEENITLPEENITSQEGPVKKEYITMNGNTGIFIMVGVALLVAIIGFFLLGRKS